MTPDEFRATLPSFLGPPREAAILAAFQAGGGVEWDFIPVDASGNGHNVQFFASIDVLAIGTPDNCVRVPMAPRTAQAIADIEGWMLPTARMSDLIWLAASSKLNPKTHPEAVGKTGIGGQTSTSLFFQHSAEIDVQLGGAPQGLVAGHKKDVVICNRLAKLPGRVAIYGWHERAKSGQSAPATMPGCFPIQPLSTRHENGYADYSHGVRKIGLTVVVDGILVPMVAALADPSIAPLLLCPAGTMPFNNPRGFAGDDASPGFPVVRVPDAPPDVSGEGPVGPPRTGGGGVAPSCSGFAGACSVGGVPPTSGRVVAGLVGAGVSLGLALAVERALR